MSKNVKVNDMTYNGVSTVELPLASGSGKAQFKDVDEITTPSGTINITANGTHDVTNYASAVVNVTSDGGSVSGESLPFNAYKYGTVTLAEDKKENETLEIEIGWENKPRIFALLKTDGYNVAWYRTYGLAGVYYLTDTDLADGNEYQHSGYGNGAGEERNKVQKSVVYLNGKMIITCDNNPLAAGKYGWIAIGD